MALWHRLRNVFRPDSADDIDEELRLHIEEAIDRGRDPNEARRSLGSPLKFREESRDARVVQWLDSLRADTIGAVRRLRKNSVSSSAAILSLALAIGACTAAFRVADALLWRSLPIAHAERLHVLQLSGRTPDGTTASSYTWAYPQFAAMRDSVKDDAAFLASSVAAPLDVTIAGGTDVEKAQVQFVSGAMFTEFGLKPTVGRLFAASDDVVPNGHPYAVLSSAYWRNRFGADPTVIGRSLTIGRNMLTIAGVIDGPFIGTDPGAAVDVFVPAAMHAYFTKNDATWLRAFAMLRPGASAQAVSERAAVTWRAEERERAKSFVDMPAPVIEEMLRLGIALVPSAAGTSQMSRDYAMPMKALLTMVGLVLLIASGNIANLMSAQAAARARELALRAAIGAGRGRLIQLTIVESTVIAGAAAAIGAVFSAWAAPFVVSLAAPKDAPVALAMPLDWRVIGFSLVMALAVTALFSVLPALSTSTIRPLDAMRGTSNRHSRRPVARTLIGAQVAFCVFVLFVAGLSVATFARLSSRSWGFSAERVAAISVDAAEPQTIAAWHHLREELASRAGVESVAIAGWPMLQGLSWNRFVSIDGAPATSTLAQLLNVSPEFLDTMKMPLLAGRAFNAQDRAADMAVVNETFLKTFMRNVPAHDAIGHRVIAGEDRYEIVGVMRDAVYKNVHEAVLPLAFVPFAPPQDVRAWQRRSASLIIRTADDSTQNWREIVRSISPVMRVTSVRSQQAIVDAQTTRERLIAMLGGFFGAVALVLTGVGLYGLLHYSVAQRSREIGIRRAIGATGARIIAQLTGDVSVIIAAGTIGGLALGFGASRQLQSIFYGVRPTDALMLASPAAFVIIVAAMAACAPIIRAVRINPTTILRDE